jgi:hypothetical protein
MDAAEVTAIAQGIGTFVALVAVLFALRHNNRDYDLGRKALEHEQRNAEAQASRTEAAARLSEEYSSRVVNALEALAAGGMGGAAVRPKVAWSLVHDSGQAYRLTNTGDLTAEAVMVQSHETLELIEGSNSTSTLRPGEALTFYAAPDFGTEDMTITVAWIDDESSESVRTWRYPLPYVQT